MRSAVSISKKIGLRVRGVKYIGPNDFNKVRKNKATTEDLYLKSDPRKDAQGYLDALKKNELENFLQTHNAL